MLLLLTVQNKEVCQSGLHWHNVSTKVCAHFAVASAVQRSMLLLVTWTQFVGQWSLTCGWMGHEVSKLESNFD